MVLTWVDHQPEPPPVAPRDFVKTNMLALSSGARSSEEIAEFRRSHDFRQVCDCGGCLRVLADVFHTLAVFAFASCSALGLHRRNLDLI